ncbi:uncharacterized protein HaLaN_17222 [Haematococcus lacustris]|uniref:RNA helicase n=1 Tax=Haematococcus lacustris TaxID=44745 RepID=A0A699ZE62_HAELA|nr:uncharacterized protein HaLaN_17222 [Haematococcus lacustris]
MASVQGSLAACYPQSLPLRPTVPIRSLYGVQSVCGPSAHLCNRGLILARAVVENLGLSPETVAAVKKRGINSLFSIQKAVFAPAMEGRDMIGRAKTGSGKTLAFALPVVEGCIKENKVTRPARGRPPRALVMAPTRELANQVAREFETVCPSLSVAPVYGGVSIGGQMRELERGVDVVVGTPGRIIDLIERGALKLDSVRYAILDEADQMLDMGFEEDMEKILSYVPVERQTLLFSATMPKWVSKIARRFQKNPLLVDLVGEENTGRLADTIRLLVMQARLQGCRGWSSRDVVKGLYMMRQWVESAQKVNATIDAMNLHAAGGKTIVFVNTKVMADQLMDSVSQTHPCAALHGDITQALRERSLQQFRDGKFSVLVATDVAARGLDIPSVDLVVHYDVPQDAEAFLHRSGRTGRAGKTGTTVLLFTEREIRSVGQILATTKTKNAELMGAPEPQEVLTRAARSVLNQLDKVDPSIINFFVPAAEKLLGSEQPSRVLAAALAALGGFRRAPQPRSLLTYEEGFVTLRLMGPPGTIDGFSSLTKVMRALVSKARLGRDLDQYAFGKIKLVEDRASGLAGAAFDLPAEDGAMVMDSPVVQAVANKAGYLLDRPKSLPLDVSEMMSSGERGGRFGRQGGRSGGDRGRDRGFSRDRGGGGGYGNGSSARGYGSRGGSGFSQGGGQRSSSLRSNSSGGGRGARASDDFYDASSSSDSYFDFDSGAKGRGRSSKRAGFDAGSSW